ncbi:MAG TPA: carboxypeptidase-like regulatory domain-containing protein [Gemmatimonadaceae bacterium]|nr:carboxypeptidase-like regulatory domain-containing protein [Gemmatimonadaceae bacterium]
MHARFLLLILAAAAAACGGESAAPEPDPLDGLRNTVARDSAGNAPPAQSVAGPGHFRGTVRASEWTGGPDTLANSVRIAGVRVIAYQRRADGSAGAQAASTTTDARGEWQLPTLPGGEYVVTFTPPESAGFQGVWTIATAHPKSHEWPWWVTLPRAS